jgi:hypothetical protein
MDRSVDIEDEPFLNGLATPARSALVHEECIVPADGADESPGTLQVRRYTVGTTFAKATAGRVGRHFPESPPPKDFGYRPLLPSKPAPQEAAPAPGVYCVTLTVRAPPLP